MKRLNVISMFLTFLTLITIIFSLGMTSQGKADIVLSQLKSEKELKDAKQWMVIKERKCDYLILASQTSAKQFSKDKAKIVNMYSEYFTYSVPASSDYNMFHATDKNGDLHIKAVNVDPQDTGIFENHTKVANSVQIYNTLRGVAKAIK